jgi:hypothetical protein
MMDDLQCQQLEKMRIERINTQKNKEEYKKLTEMQLFLESCGLKVWREVIPDQCLGWEHPYSVDLIFEILNYGLFGVEGKNLNTHGQGSKYAEAYLQIRDKYKDKTYFNGKKVRRWCVLGANSSDMGGERIVVFLKHFFNKLGISYIENLKDSVVIDSLTQHRIFIKKNNITIDESSLMDYGKMIK